MKLSLIVCIAVALTCISCVKMPIMISGNKNTITGIESKINTQEELANQLSTQINKENVKKVLAIKIETPFDIPATMKQFRKMTFNMPNFLKMFGLENSIQSIESQYDANVLIDSLSKNHKELVQVISTPIHKIAKLEKVLFEEINQVLSGDVLLVVTFEPSSDVQGRARILEEVQEEQNEHTAKLGAGQTEHFLSEIKSSTLWGMIIVLFIIYVLYSTVGVLFNIKSPASFVAKPHHIGKES